MGHLEEKEDSSMLVLGTGGHLIVVDHLGAAILYSRQTGSLVDIKKNVTVGNRM